MLYKARKQSHGLDKSLLPVKRSHRNELQRDWGSHRWRELTEIPDHPRFLLMV